MAPAAAEEEEEAAGACFASLPPALALDVLSRAPADARARAACACRGWRALLASGGARPWARLDLSPGSGVSVRVTDAVLLGAAARGCLTSLDVSGCTTITHAALRAVLMANGGTLTELRLGRYGPLAPTYIAACQLLAAAPRLHTLHADALSCAPRRAAALLTGAPPFAPLALAQLVVSFVHRNDDIARVQPLVDGIAAHEALTSLELHSAPLYDTSAMHAVAAVVIARRLRSLTLHGCWLSPASGPDLTRLVCQSALTTLHVYNDGAPLLDALPTELMGVHLSASAITSLSLRAVALFEDAPSACRMLAHLKKHRALRALCVADNAVPVRAARDVGRALGSLLLTPCGRATATAADDADAADADAALCGLTELDVSGCALGDTGMHHLLAGLARGDGGGGGSGATTRLRALHCGGNELSDAYKRERFYDALYAGGLVLQ
jgi:hypothetical protein